jgi:uncharacterized protein YdhG (YjbR/CyaY superfamily)
MDEATVDTYIASLADAEARRRMTEIRRIIHDTAADVGETISYGMPTFTTGGRRLVHVAAWKQHIAIYPVPTGDDTFERDIAPYRAARSTARFPMRRPLPHSLVERIVRLLAVS